VKANRRLATLTSCTLLLSLVVVQGHDRARFGETRSITLPSYAILDENAQPLVAASGKVGFVSSVTGGSLIAFSVTSGRVVSSLVVGETAGPISMVETDGKRLIAVPAANSPAAGHPATISIVDATRAGSLELMSLLVLPADAQITGTTEALLTRDGRFCLVATTFAEPELLLFNVETGQIQSRLPLLGRPSSVALLDSGGVRRVAITSSTANLLSVVRADAQGDLSLLSSFSPPGTRFDESNNPAFSFDGRVVYIGAAEGDRVFAIDSRTGGALSSVEVSAPQRITVTKTRDGFEMLGVSRIRRPVQGRPGGVTLLVNRGGRLDVKTDFTPPEGIDFSHANNVAFDREASTAFVASETGFLFAFNTETGEVESHHQIGRGLRRLALSELARSVAVIRTSSAADEIVIVGFDLIDSGEPEAPPRITSLKPDTVEQGRLKNLRLIVRGENFGEGATLVVGDVDVAADIARQGRELRAKLPKSWFDKVGRLSVQVRTVGGVLCEPAYVTVRRPEDPLIDKITPEEVPGPASSFTLKVRGANFRASSTVIVDERRLNTEYRSDKDLRAKVPAELVRTVARLRVRVGDLTVPDLTSNEKELTVFGPRITALKPYVEPVVAGDGSFKMKIEGENFRNGAGVEINGKAVPRSRVRRLGSRAIKLTVSSRFIQDAGKLSVVVRNPEGNASDAREIEAVPPDIASFAPGEVLAGLKDVKVRLSGSNFRKGLRVYVGKAETGEAFRIDRRRIRFRSSAQLVVRLKEQLNQLVAQPGTLKFQVVNPNDGDGVPSANRELRVVGPVITEAAITPIKGDQAHVRLVITGANFRKGAEVEFFKDGDVYVRQRVPEGLKNDRITLTFKAKKVDGLVNLEARVVNPGDVKSNSVRPHRSEGVDISDE
jgi:hypothetical protein